MRFPPSAASRYWWCFALIYPISFVDRMCDTVLSGEAAGPLAKQTADVPERPRTRAVRFDYGGTIRALTEGANVRVWLPVPTSDEYQQVERLAVDAPGRWRLETEPDYRNQILYFESAAPASGSLSFNVSYGVRRSEAWGLPADNRHLMLVDLADNERRRFLSANAKIPVTGKPLELIRDLTLPRHDTVALGRLLYDRVDAHMRYDKSKPGYGNGDAVWACESRYGNCTDDQIWPREDIDYKFVYTDQAQTEVEPYVTRALRGQVVWMAEALARRHGVKSVPESADRVLALETRDGQLVPLVEDIRGRAFRRDPRLQNIDVELLVRQYRDFPFVQVIQVFALKEEGKYELDYWCDTCAIAMFELKACDCCQGDIELRQRKVPATVPVEGE